MKKLLSYASGTLLASQMLVQQAFGLSTLVPPPDIPGLAPGDGVKGITDAIVAILVIVLNFVLLLAVVFVVVAGIRLIVSGGDEGEKDKAKKTIIYVIVGIVVVLLARVIVSFVAELF